MIINILQNEIERNNVNKTNACRSSKSNSFWRIIISDYYYSIYHACLPKQSNNQATIERKHKEEQFQKKQDEEIALKEELNNLNDKDYIEKVARDDYYLSNNGEIIFKLPNDKSSSNSKSSSNNKKSRQL